MLLVIHCCKLSAAHSLSSFIPIDTLHCFLLLTTIQQTTESQVHCGYSPRRSCIPTCSTRVSQLLQLIKSSKFSCKCGLFIPSNPPHCTKQILYTIQTKRWLTNSFKAEVLAVYQKQHSGRHNQLNHRRLSSQLQHKSPVPHVTHEKHIGHLSHV